MKSRDGSKSRRRFLRRLGRFAFPAKSHAQAGSPRRVKGTYRDVLGYVPFAPFFAPLLAPGAILSIKVDPTAVETLPGWMLESKNRAVVAERIRALLA